MYLTGGEWLALAVIAVGGLYFFSAIRVRELALQAVAQASRRDNFQWLDQAVHMQRVSLSRDDSGRWRIWRQYRFDYSYDGVERRQGFVIMLGRRVQAVVVSEPERVLH